MSQSITVTDVRFEHHISGDTLGIGQPRPRISWRISGAPTGFTQHQYEIQSFQSSNLQTESHNQSLQVTSNLSTLVPWPFDAALKSREGLFIRVRVTGKDSNEPSKWSELSYVETGLLDRSDWKCKRICAAWDQDSTKPRPEELYRRDFDANGSSKLVRARLYMTSQGIYEAEINGTRVGDHFLAPGWTAYDQRLPYQTYDVLHLLSTDTTENCIGVRLAEGWFCGRIGFEGGRRNIWGTKTAVMTQLELTYDDDTVDVVCSDESWETTEGPIRLAEIYHGEKYDSNYEIAGWSLPRPRRKEPTSSWSKVTVMEDLPASTELIAPTGAPIRRLHTLSPVEVITTPKGKLVLDFGQNLVGYTRIKNIRGNAGQTITMFHAEVLEDGECARRPLREADALDEFKMAGSSTGESWEPRFTFHGYRYVQIDGLSSDTDPFTSFEAVVVYSEMEPTGQFSCSNQMLNQLHSNVTWGMRGNFVGLPTDCPQRDERLGWTGDLALFAPTACFLYNCAGMLKSWLADMAIDQTVLGGIPPLVSPNVLYGQETAFPKIYPCAIWADVTILAPWAIYQATSDTQILADQYHSMEAWLKALPRDIENNRRLYLPKIFQLGDWLDPDAPPDNPGDAKTDGHLVANAFLAHSLDLITQISSILNKKTEAERYREEAATVRQEFADEYITPNGRMTSDSQTAYALAICFDLFHSPKQKIRAGARLAEIVRKNAFRIGTGFAGTPYVCEALTQTGHTQVAYRMLLEEKCSSWLYPMTMGATTMWERWDSMLPDGSVNPGDMTSFNHYALGAVAVFMHERLGGLSCLEPGWKKSRAAPMLGGHFTHASVSHLSPYGLVSCEWRIVEEVFEMKVQVPQGTTMEVVLPAAGERVRVVQAGEHSFSVRYEKPQGWPPKAITWSDPA